MANQNELAQQALQEYVAECDEIVQKVFTHLSLIEKGEIKKESIDELYRNMHTMKGSSMLFGFVDIGELAHAMETCLDPFRKELREFDSQLIDALFRCLSLIENWIQFLKGEGEFSREQLLERKNYELPALVESAANIFGGNFTIVYDSLYGESKEDMSSIQKETVLTNQTNTKLANDKEMLSSSEEISKPVKESNQTSDSSIMEGRDSMPNTNAATKLSETRPSEATPKRESEASKSSETIRVSVDLVDKLMNLVGELVLVRNQVTQYTRNSEDLEFVNLGQTLDVVTSDLQGEIMKTRMQPIGNVVNKYQRLVRDMATEFGKKIELKVFGADTELDRTLLETIKDPLLHAVRNACDHGLETPEERKTMGKDPVGNVHIRSFHEGGQVVIEISDDGKGLNRDKILRSAIEKGLVTHDESSKLSEREVFSLIMEPGFSTAEKVSSVSGRGVGMDVVKTNIEKIGGTVELNSVQGEGATVRMKIPLTLAIVPAMIIRDKSNTFAIPQVKLVELVRVDPEEGSSQQIEILQGKPVFRLRGDLLPLVQLNSVMSGSNDTNQSEFAEKAVNIVVLNSDGQQFGLIVEEILDTADIVVKPISNFLKSIGLFSGATIMGDGSVSLILDVMGVAQKARIEQADSLNSKQWNRAEKNVDKINEDTQEFLIFRVNAPGRYAIPLCLVNRLEEFSIDQIEFSGDQRVVRYRDGILPIISLNHELGFMGSTQQGRDSETIKVIVTEKRSMLFGIEVNQIDDVVLIEKPVNSEMKDRDGIMGNVIYEEQVVVIVDVLRILEKVMAQIAGGRTDLSKKVSSIKKTKGSGRILLAEDAAFFRVRIKNLLEKAGYSVDVAVNGKAALEQFEDAEDGTYNLILSDIEMPYLNGLGLAKAVRSSKKHNDIPLLAVTTKFRDRDIQEGMAAGFNAYIEKLDEDQLLSQIEELLKRG